MNGETDIHINIKTKGQRDKKVYKETDRQTDKQTNRKSDRAKIRQTEKERKKESWTDRSTKGINRHRHRRTNKLIHKQQTLHVK